MFIVIFLGLFRLFSITALTPVKIRIGWCERTRCIYFVIATFHDMIILKGEKIMNFKHKNLSLYNDDEDEIFFPGQFDLENNELLNQMLVQIKENSKSSVKNTKITIWLSITSIFISLIFGIINLILMFL